MATALMRLTRPPGRIAGGRVLLDGTDLLTLDDKALRNGCACATSRSCPRAP